MKQALQEYVDSRGVVLRVDREAGVLRGVKLIGLQSQNGRRYRDSALGAAAALYEAAKVNVNHAAEGSATPRDYRDRLGAIRNVEHRPGEGLFGDLYFNPKHALAEQLIWDAEHNPSNVGFSHNVLARLSREAGAVVVDEITQVQSVDLVADPASTRGLFEHAEALRESQHELFWGELTVERLRERRPDVCAALEATALKTVEPELNELRAAERARQREDRIARVVAELAPAAAEARSPRSWLGDALFEVLLTIEDDDRVRQLVQERIDAAGQYSQRDLRDARKPRSVEQYGAASRSQRVTNGVDFARALQGAA